MMIIMIILIIVTNGVHACAMESYDIVYKDKAAMLEKNNYNLINAIRLLGIRSEISFSKSQIGFIFSLSVLCVPFM